MVAVLVLKEDPILLVRGGDGAALLLLLQLLLGLVMMLIVLKMLVLVIAGEGAQTAQAGRVGLGSRREGRLRIRILGVLWGPVAVHQSVRVGDLVGSIELLRWEGRLLLSGHGVDGRAHGLTMGVRNGGGTPVGVGRLWNLGQRA
jgi:hypothetical protein